MINLLPPAVKEERLYGRRNRSLLGYSIILLSTSLAVMAIISASLQFVGPDETKLREEIRTSAAEIVLLESAVKPVESVATRLNTAKSINDLSIQFSKIIPEIGSVLPNGVILNALSLTGGVTDSLQLDVDLTSAELAPVLIRNLVESDLFETADLSSLSPKGGASDENTSAYSFTASITASFKGAAAAKKKAEAAQKAAAEAAAAKSAEGAAQ